MKKLMALLLAAAMMVSMTACGAPAATETEGEKVLLIGGTGPLTGDYATYGTSVKQGAELAAEEINAAGGLNGIKFKLVATDDKHDATNVATNYSSMLEGGMQEKIAELFGEPFIYEVVEEGEVQ